MTKDQLLKCKGAWLYYYKDGAVYKVSFVDKVSGKYRFFKIFTDKCIRLREEQLCFVSESLVELMTTIKKQCNDILNTNLRSDGIHYYSPVTGMFGGKLND